MNDYEAYLSSLTDPALAAEKSRVIELVNRTQEDYIEACEDPAVSDQEVALLRSAYNEAMGQYGAVQTEAWQRAGA